MLADFHHISYVAQSLARSVVPVFAFEVRLHEGTLEAVKLFTDVSIKRGT